MEKKMDFKNLQQQVEDHVLSLFRMNSDGGLYYHDRKHTQFVVNNAGQIAKHYLLNDTEMFVLNVSAWFHDLGYLFDCRNHTYKSADLAVEFLQFHNADPDLIQQVSACILSLGEHQKPVTMVEQILCDADLFYLGTDDFERSNKLLRRERNAMYHPELCKSEWHAITIELFENHGYFTDYCHSMLDEKKMENLGKLRVSELCNDIGVAVSEKSTDLKAGVTTLRSSNKKSLNRSLHAIFRVSSNNHSLLSNLADNKAHILITVNSIIISAVISLVLRKLNSNTFLTIPTFTLLIVALVTTILAILATRPTIPDGTFSQDDIDEKTVNLLFFGNFYRMDFEDYKKAIGIVTDDNDFAYDNLVRDIYVQGIVLGKKYGLLKVCYNVFMVGLTVSIVAYIIAAAVAEKSIHPHTATLLSHPVYTSQAINVRQVPILSIINSSVTP